MMQPQQTYKLLFSDFPDVVNIAEMCQMLGGISKKTGYRLLKQGVPIELAVILAAFYGLRRSEALGLKWDAIDFEKKQLLFVTLSLKRALMAKAF